MSLGYFPSFEALRSVLRLDPSLGQYGLDHILGF